MSTEHTIDEEIKEAIGASPTPAPAVAPQVFFHPRIAANIVQFLRRVQVTGEEAFALAEAFQALQSFAAPPPSGPGVPFPGV